MMVVIAIAFGPFVYASLYYAMHPDVATVSSAGDFRWMMVSEVVQGTLVAAFLWARGWTTAALGFTKPSWKDLRHGAALVGVVIAGSWITYYIALAIRPELQVANVAIDEGGMPPALVLAFSIVNATYEELFVCAYIVAAWRGPDSWNALAFSSILRLSYHLYQGAIAIALIFPFGVMFAWYFARQRRILPLIIAHGVIDVLGLLQSGA